VPSEGYRHAESRPGEPDSQHCRTQYGIQLPDLDYSRPPVASSKTSRNAARKSATASSTRLGNVTGASEQIPPRWLEVAFWGVIALGVLIYWPSLEAPLALDDFAQRAMIEGHLTFRHGLLNLYDYISDANRAVLLDRGAIPWWTDPRLVIRFLRPAASALVWLDYTFFRYHALGPHLHSLLWWGAAVFGVRTLLLGLMKPRPALLGAAVFALAPCHAVPIVWLANRPELVSVALGTWALAFYSRWRESRAVQDGAWTLALWTATFLTGEYAFCFVGYALAIELSRRNDDLMARLRGLAPFAIPGLIYGVVHLALRYGTQASGFYRSPLDGFDAYVRGAPRAISVLLGSGWFGLDDMAWAAKPASSTILLGLGIAAVLVIPFAHLRKRLEGAERDRATWLLIGSVLALGPVLAAEPSSRLLGAAMVGISGICGLLFDVAIPARKRKRRRRTAIAQETVPVAVTSLVALALVYAHFVAGPIDGRRVAQMATQAELAFMPRVEWLASHLDHGKSTVALLRAESPPLVLWAPFMLRDAAPERWRVLSQTPGPVTVIRTGPRMVTLMSGGPPLFPVGPSDFFRVGSLIQDQVVDLPGMQATVLEVDAQGLPRRVQFAFEHDIDDVQWLVESGDGLREVKLPEPSFAMRLDP
jgi:hypothetical protein